MMAKVKSAPKISPGRQELARQFVKTYLIPDRFINYHPNTKLSKVIGFVGPRGSMKSLSGAAMTVIDYLVPGYDVWSNMPISWGVKLGDDYALYQTKDLNKADLLRLNLQKGMIFIDEINLEFSEARRSMTNRNLTFNKLIQQIRKKSINMIYTVQHEMWIDNRLRWQTDLFIKCQDVRMKPGGNRLPYDWGEYSEWTGFDMTGLLGAGAYPETKLKTFQMRFYGKMWWNTFDTDLIQDEEIEYGDISIETPEFDSYYTELYKAVTETINTYVSVGLLEVKEDDVLSDIGKNTELNIWNTATIEHIKQMLKRVTMRGPKTSSGDPIWVFNRVFNLRERELQKE